MLESKAKYYEEVVSGKKLTDEGDEEIFLVNFDQKVIEETQDDESAAEELKFKQNLNEDEYNKMLKEKWETELIQNLEKETIHYQDIRYNEIRNMGVGNYQFSRDEDKRKIQMEFFKKIEKESKTRRVFNEIHKLKREKILVDRLSKVKQKRLLKFGYSLGQIKEFCVEFEKENEEIDKEICQLEKLLEDPNLLDSKNESNEDLENNEFNKPSIQRPILEREWDKPKLKEKMWTRHVDKLRKERNKMFAPPESYVSGQKKKKKSKTKIHKIQENEIDREKTATQTEPKFSFNFPFPPPPIPPPGVFFPPFPPIPTMAFPFPPPSTS
ncbi:coiled-coil domain-containing [Brachionus plicatilis]|uniref:Coiled-coil domain-containing n=1 Tax=Brachionus plicatilis TaxID=10195 RepID=A0A3M7RFK0_BRAPC|nr:coiled-coil domain-containing [Brachionus plicatilis]